MKEGQREGKDWLTIAKVGGGNTRWQGAVKGQETPKRGRRVRRNRNLALVHADMSTTTSASLGQPCTTYIPSMGKKKGGKTRKKKKEIRDGF